MPQLRSNENTGLASFWNPLRRHPHQHFAIAIGDLLSERFGFGQGGDAQLSLEDRPALAIVAHPFVAMS